jgi:hypothetical protein
MPETKTSSNIDTCNRMTQSNAILVAVNNIICLKPRPVLTSIPAIE